MSGVIRTITSGLVAGVVALSVAGTATAAEPENILKYRVNLMKTQTGHLVAIAAVVKGEVPYGAHVKAHADAMRALSEMVSGVFPEGSAVGDSRAKPEIWRDWDKFLAIYENYKTEVAKLAQVAAGGDLGAIGAQLGAVGKSCGACHKPFRKEKN